MSQDRVVMMIAVLAVAASLIAAGFSYYSLNYGSRLSGLASSDTGTTSLTVSTEADIEFTDQNITWGSGRVNISKVRAVLDSDAGTVINGTWTPEDSGFILENKGNTNVTLNIKVDDTNTSFLGGTGGGGPQYMWKVEDGPNATATCAAHGGGIENASIYNHTSQTDTKVCNHMGYLSGANEFSIDIRLHIPYDSNLGQTTDTITASAAASP